jgi:hypothetical protein
MAYTVKVDDNFHYMDESYRYTAGEFETADEAISFAKKIVDDCLAHLLPQYQKQLRQKDLTAEGLHAYYRGFGEDPFIMGDPFSAWTYAEQRCEEIVKELSAKEVRGSFEPDDFDEPYFDGAFFPIRSNEAYLKYELLGFVRKLITENPIPPDVMRKLSTLLLGLERLPRITSGLTVELSIVAREAGNMDYYDLQISEERLALGSGGHVYSPEVGGDSFSSTLFECEASGFRDGSLDAWDLGSWMLSALELLNAGGVIEVQDESEIDSLPWDSELEKDPFEELEERISRWEKCFGDN